MGMLSERHKERKIFFEQEQNPTETIQSLEGGGGKG